MAVVWGIVHDDQTVTLNIREQLAGKPLLKMLCSHLVMVIACIFFGAKYKSGVGNPTTLTACSKNDEPCTFTRGSPVKNKSLTYGVLTDYRTYLTPPSVPPVTVSLSTQAQTFPS